MTNQFSRISISNYFWRKWRPVLGNSLAILIIEARTRCSESGAVGSFRLSLGDFAKAAGFSEKQVFRLLKRPFAKKFICYKSTYVYDGKLGKTIRGKCQFHVALKDPPFPEEKFAFSSVAVVNRQTPLRVILQAQNVGKVSPFAVEPTGQNVVNILNVINNIINTAATTHCTPSKNFEKGEQIEVSGKEAVVAAVRNKFRNAISAKKVVALIQNTGLENVRNQLLWFPFRDNSWARKGPAVAFITYCEQELNAPENKAEVKASVHVVDDRNFGLFLEQQENVVERRKRYGEPEKYDGLKMEISERITCDSPAASGIFKTCFIGEIRVEGSEQIVVIDTPNPFCREWLKRGYEKKILKFLKEKSERFTRLDFVSLNQ